jgi:aryl-alcohol dehydrogenase-like predicted oxidoreductase
LPAIRNIRGDDIVPLDGARRRQRLAESLGAASLTLDHDVLARIEQAVPAGSAAGGRYAEFLLADMDSEH